MGLNLKFWDLWINGFLVEISGDFWVSGLIGSDGFVMEING